MCCDIPSHSMRHLSSEVCKLALYSMSQDSIEVPQFQRMKFGGTCATRECFSVRGVEPSQSGTLMSLKPLKYGELANARPPGHCSCPLYLEKHPKGGRQKLPWNSIVLRVQDLLFQST